MRLSAVYIPKNTLPHIFGDNHEGQTLNLGGKYLYAVEETDNKITLLSRIPNEKFIANFWEGNISNISAIVGRNGIGKTSVLRALNHPPDPNHKSLLYYFEIDDDIELVILNETSKLDDADSAIPIMISRIDRSNIEVQYYSPVLDFELSEALSSIALVKYHNNTLENYYLDSIIRNLYFLNDPVADILKEVYNDFPFYDKYLIKVAKHRKTNFEEVYILSNFGNPNKGDVLRNYITGDLNRLKDAPQETFDRNDIEDIYKEHLSMLESESFTVLFSKIWELPEYKTSNNQNYIHDSNNFIKNFEVTILSYSVLGAVFAQTGLGDGFDFNVILLEESFEKKLNKFLELYLKNEDKILYERIKKELSEDIKIIDKELIIEIINKDKFSQLSGVKTKPIRDRMIDDTNRFFQTLEFYNYIKNLIEEKVLTEEKGNLIFNVKGDVKKYDDFFKEYEKLLESYKSIPRQVSILNFVPNKKLSTGEKSLIDFYSSLFNYIEKHRLNKHYRKKNYLLLLDEPELGYHPIWKKKFIQAITKTLPVLFSKLTADEKHFLNQKAPNLQIIFSTHDPLTLSDIPNQNVIYLEKDNTNATISNHNYKSFAANITDLLADSFFVEDGLIGDFAKEKIHKTIMWLNNHENKELASYYELIIKNIDEPILQIKLSEMYDEKMRTDVSIALIDKQIRELESLKTNLLKS